MTEGTRLRVSVLTPVLDEAEHLAPVIDRMRRQTLDDIEFLVIDVGASDRTSRILRAAAREDPRIRLLTQPGARTPQALNAGLRMARGSYVARMDAHTLYPEDYLERAVERLERGDVASVSGPQRPYGTGRWSKRVALALQTPLGTGGARFRRGVSHEIEVDSGFTGVWRRELLEELGGWDEDWPVNQDGELAARIRERGGRIVCLPELTAVYIPRDSLLSLAAQYWRYGQFKCKTCCRHPRSFRRSHVLPPGLVVTTVLALGRGAPAIASRVGVGVYGMAMAATYARLAQRAGARDAAGAIAALATMHYAWGAGFLLGIANCEEPTAVLAWIVEGSGDS